MQKKHCRRTNRGPSPGPVLFSLQTGPDAGETDVDEGERMIQWQIRQLGHNIPFTKRKNP